MTRFYSLLIILLISISSCKSKKMVLSDARDLKGKTAAKGNVKARYAALFNVSEREIKNEDLYSFIDSWMGTPYRENGMTKNGTDCSGFVSVLEKEIYGLQVPRIARQMAESVKRKYETDLEEGDLVFFDFDGVKFSHVGIYLTNNKFVHASTSKGVIISDLKDPWYYKYFSRAGSMTKAPVN